MRKKSAAPDLRLVEPTPFDPAAPPSNVGEAGAKLWRSIQSDFRVDDAPGWNTLLQICHAADIAETAHARGLLAASVAWISMLSQPAVSRRKRTSRSALGSNKCHELPHLFYRGSRRTLPWAAKQFDAKKKASR